MNRRHIRWVLVLLFSLSLADGYGRAQQPVSDQRPAFRSGVELVTVEVGVVDKDGRPVRGLGPQDFTVTVEGKPRRVVSADFVDASSEAELARRPEVVPISTNEGGGAGRLFLFVVDKQTLEAGEGRRIATDASRLLSRLTLSDRSGLVPLPVGRSIAFTWAHRRVAEALVQAATGGGDSGAMTWEFGSLAEARDIATRGSFALREVVARECSTSLASGIDAGITPPRPSPPPGPGSSTPSGGNPPGGQSGGAGGGSSGRPPESGSSPGSLSENFAQDRCVRQIQSEAEMAWSIARANSLASVTALRQVLSSLARVQGDKTVVLISGGWPLDEHDETSLMSTLAAEAAAARVKLFTIYVPRSTISASRRSTSMSPRSDRNLFYFPLENLAGMTGGRAFRAEVGAQAIFDRLASELAGYYRIGIEKDASDVGASGRRMKIKTGRGGVTVRARDIFDVVSYEDRDWAARLASALEAPVPATAVGLRVTSYVAADPTDPASLRILLAGEASRLQPGAATLHLLVRDLDGRRIVAGDQPLGDVTESAMRFATHVAVPRGSYMVRIAIQDGAGRVGSVDRRVEAHPVSLGPIAVTGPMFVQASGSGRREPQLALDGVGSDERLALEVELEGDSAKLAAADVVFEIAASPDGPALLQMPASVTPGQRDTAMIAQAVADVRILPAGEYLARVNVRSGSELLGDVRRTFAILEAPVPAADERSAASDVPTTGSAAMASPLRGRAVAALPPFTLERVLSREVLGAFLDRVAARRDAAFPGAGDLIARARTGDIAALKVSDAQAAQTPIAAFVQGLTLLAQNKPDPAGRAFRTAMRAAPDFSAAMVYLGACYAAAGNDKEAAAIWRTALIREGSAPAVHLLLADALLRQGNGNLALQVVNAARGRWPDDEELKHRFMLASFLAGDLAAGFRTLDEFIERGGADEPSLSLALMVLYDALTHGRTIEGAEPDRSRMLHLADVYRTQGGPSLALVETWVAAVSGKTGKARQ